MKLLIVLALVATAYAAPQYLMSEGATVIEGAKSISSGPAGIVHHDSGSIIKPDGNVVLKTVDPVLTPLVKPLVDPIPMVKTVTSLPVVSTRITSLDTLNPLVDTLSPLVDNIPIYSTRISTMPLSTGLDIWGRSFWDHIYWK